MAVAQLVESRIVIPVVVGSSPISHPSVYKETPLSFVNVNPILQPVVVLLGWTLFMSVWVLVTRIPAMLAQKACR